MLTLAQAASALPDGRVKFTAHVVGDPDGVSTTFVLPTEEAKALGEGLVQLADQVLAERQRSQEETLRRIEGMPS
jgi:hypothetical protein